MIKLALTKGPFWQCRVVGVHSTVGAPDIYQRLPNTKGLWTHNPSAEAPNALAIGAFHNIRTQ